MIIRTAASRQDVEQAFAVYWPLDNPGQSMDSAQAASDLAHWMALYANCPEGFWVAEDEVAGRVVGVASAVRLPPQWILSNFYVSEDYQGRGIGKALLEQAYAVRAGCERFLVHASSHPSAQRLYLQLGLYPQSYSIFFHGRPHEAVRPAALSAEAIPVEEILPVLNALDGQALGFTRTAFHRRWGGLGRYFLVRQGAQIVGYFRASADGMLGPLVVSEEGYLADTLDWAIFRQIEISGEPHQVFVPGANRAAIDRLFAHGYRYQDYNLLLSSHPMPGLARVIFHDTDLL